MLKMAYRLLFPSESLFLTNPLKSNEKVSKIAEIYFLLKILKNHDYIEPLLLIDQKHQFTSNINIHWQAV